MYATIRRYEGIDESRSEEIARRVIDEFIPQVSELEGFDGYFVLNAGRVLATISIFESESGAEESTRLARDFIHDEGLQDAIPNPPVVTAGEVVAHKARAAALA
jgi:hypothetical protein